MFDKKFRELVTLNRAARRVENRNFIMCYHARSIIETLNFRNHSFLVGEKKKNEIDRDIEREIEKESERQRERNYTHGMNLVDSS